VYPHRPTTAAAPSRECADCGSDAAGMAGVRRRRPGWTAACSAPRHLAV